MGRPRKHAAIHKLQGTYQHVRHDLGADNLDAVGACEPTRSLNEHGEKFFRTVLAAYPAGTLGASDAEPLTTLAEWVQRMFALRSAEIETGQMMIKEAGEITKHFNALSSRFGLTPADKGKVKLAASKQDMTEAKFFGVTG